MTAFSNPQRVGIAGYSGAAMEPFISLDGNVLFFNNSNAPGVDTALFFAVRAGGDPTRFNYAGPVLGVNSAALEACVSMDRNGLLYFISTATYAQDQETIRCGSFLGGAVTAVRTVYGLSLKKPGTLNMDAAISPDGSTLFYCENSFGGDGYPVSGAIHIASMIGFSYFAKAGGSDYVMQHVNAAGLVYAPAIGADGLELFLTRLPSFPPGAPPQICVAARPRLDAPFGTPEVIKACSGFVEAPTVTLDGRRLYYHRQTDDGRSFEIMTVTR